MLNNAKPYFFLNEMNKDLPAMYSTAFWCLFVVLLIFLALLRNRCYSFHRRNYVYNFEISLVVFMPNITTNHAITYINSLQEHG